MVLRGFSHEVFMGGKRWVGDGDRKERDREKEDGEREEEEKKENE